MSGPAFLKCIIFAFVAALSAMRDLKATAVFGALMCLVFAIDGAVEALRRAKE